MASVRNPILSSVYADADKEFRRGFEQGLSFDYNWLESNSLKPEDVPTHELLNTADIILLLISPDFLATDACQSIIHCAVQRHEQRSAYTIPILLRLVSPQALPFGKLRPLPSNAQPVSEWRDRDEALSDVSLGFLRIWLESKLSSSPSPASSMLPERATSTLPFRNLSFTGREELLKRLRQQLLTTGIVSLTQPRRPSSLGGIGKTQIALGICLSTSARLPGYLVDQGYYSRHDDHGYG